MLTRKSAQHCPRAFQHYLDDEPGLCGAVCVSVSKQSQKLSWVSARFVSANWGIEALVVRKEEIVSGDEMEFAMVV